MPKHKMLITEYTTHYDVEYAGPEPIAHSNLAYVKKPWGTCGDLICGLCTLSTMGLGVIGAYFGAGGDTSNPALAALSITGAGLSLIGAITGCVLSKRRLNKLRQQAFNEGADEAERRIAALNSKAPNISIQPSQEKNNILEITDPRTGAQIRGTINTVMKFFSAQQNMFIQPQQHAASSQEQKGEMAEPDIINSRMKV